MVTYNELAKLWKEATVRYHDHYDSKVHPIGLGPDRNKDTYVNGRLMKVFRDLILKRQGEGEMFISEVFSHEDFKRIKDALEFQARYAGAGEGTAELVKKVDTVRKYLKAKARARELEQELK